MSCKHCEMSLDNCTCVEIPPNFVNITAISWDDSCNNGNCVKIPADFVKDPPFSWADPCYNDKQVSPTKKEISPNKRPYNTNVKPKNKSVEKVVTYRSNGKVLKLTIQESSLDDTFSLIKQTGGTIMGVEELKPNNKSFVKTKPRVENQPCTSCGGKCPQTYCKVNEVNKCFKCLGSGCSKNWCNKMETFSICKYCKGNYSCGKTCTKKGEAKEKLRCNNCNNECERLFCETCKVFSRCRICSGNFTCGKVNTEQQCTKYNKKF